MGIKVQLPGESPPEPGNEFTSSLLKSLRELREEAALSSSDVTAAEQLIRTKTDIRQIQDGVRELYQKLDPFDPRQEKIANVYAELDKIVSAKATPSRADTTSETMLPPLPIRPQQMSAATTAASPITSDLQDRIAESLSDIRREVRGYPEATFDFPDQLLIVEDLIRKQVNWNTLQQALDSALDQTKKIGLYLQRLRDSVENEYRRNVALQSNIGILQSQLKADLAADLEKGLQRWFQTYGFCLSEWQLDRCAGLVDKAIGLPALISLVYAAASTSLVEGKYAAPEVDQMLEHLIDQLQTERIMEELPLARLNVLRGRINLYHLERPDAAQNLFEAAYRLCPSHELPTAAMGEYFLSQSDVDRAEDQFTKGLRLPPDLVDSYLGMGRLHEQQERWEQANEWYDRAADVALRGADAVALLGKLLAPASGCAYLRLAFKLGADRPEPALRAVTHALDLGIQGKGEYPLAPALRLKADILVQLGRKEEAFEAFSKAGEFFSWGQTSDDTEEARQCLEAAIQLDSEKTSNYWRLADVYLSLSYGATDDETKRRHVERGTAVWNAAARQALPDESSYWGYATRAGLAAQQAALLQGEEWRKRIELWWQAGVMMERLLLIKATRAQDWTFLARSFDQLYLYKNALKTTEKAVELRPDDRFVAEWRMFVLCNIGYFEEAIEKIEHRLQLSEDTWVYSILAWVKLHQEQYQEAKACVERAYAGTAEEKLSIWDLNLCAVIYERAKELDRANHYWEVIYQRIDEKYIDNLGFYANAAFGLGKREEAIRLLQTPILLSDPLEGNSALFDLGLFQLLSGQIDKGWKHIEEGISLHRVVRSLNFFLTECKEKLNPQDADRVAALVRARLKVLEQSKTPKEELIEAYSISGVSEQDKSWVRIGIQASLAHIYRDEGQWHEAANLYKQLLTFGPMPNDGMPPFPEARRGLELCASNIEQLGDEAFKGNQTSEAAQLYEHALQLREDSLRDEANTETAVPTAALYAKLALAVLDIQGVHVAGNHLITALKLYHQIDESNSVKKLADILKPMLRDSAHYWQVYDALNLLRTDQNDPTALRQEIVTLVEVMSNYLEDRYRFSFKQFDTPIVLPIILKIGERLIPEDTSTKNWSLFTKLIPEMRDRIKEELGVSVPGIRVRDLNGASSLSQYYEDYHILLDEVFVVDGSVRLDRKFCPHSGEELLSAGISINKLESAKNPRTGEMGYWLDEGSARQAAEHNLELWDEPLVYVIQHLEAVLRRNLANFLGVEEVQNLLNTWKKNPDTEQLIETILKTPADQLQFSRMLRELVRGQVPVTDSNRLLAVFRDEQPKRTGLQHLVDSARLVIKGQAPGNPVSTQQQPILQG